jgi:hypothetical protein
VILSRDDATLVVRAAGSRPGGEGGGQGMEAAPPGEARMESLFETVGILLSVAIVVAAAWILIRRRR